MQYRFVDLDETPIAEYPRLSTVIDGVNLDITIDGFQTLNVTGRELLSRDLETRNFKSTKAGRKGGTSRASKRDRLQTNKLLSSSFSNRVLLVQYRLKSDDYYHQLRQFEQLNYLANKEEVPIYFTDDPKYYYIGTFSNTNEVDITTNDITSEFEIICLDPYKYERKQEEWNFTTTGKYKYVSMYSPVIEKIIIKPKIATDKIRLINISSGDFIEVIHNFKTTDQLILDLTESDAKLSTGQNLNPKINILSEMEDFVLELDDELTTNISADVSICFRNRRR